MDDQDFERLLKELLLQDLSAGTEGFREALLERCKDVLCADSGGVVLDDSDLELLAAAGDAAALGFNGFDDRRRLTARG